MTAYTSSLPESLSSAAAAAWTSSRRTRCSACGEESPQLEWDRNLQVCPRCGFHAPIGAYYRLSNILDPGSFQELEDKLSPADPLAFPGYPAKLAKLEEETGLKAGAVAALGKIEGRKAVFAVLDSHFLMGSMGTAVGEKITRAAEYAARKKLPLVIFSASGGARMQEGIFSLMQMAKTAAALKKHSEAGLLYVPVLTDPTTGGVTASFAMLGDVIMAEPGALIGFAGPRVIKQTIGQELPEGFQTAEFLVEHGFVDGIVERDELKKTIHFLLRAHQSAARSRAGKKSYADFCEDTGKKFELSESLKEQTWNSTPRTAWEKVKAVRQVDRPSATDYMEHIFDYFTEAHGDRGFSDDKALIGGIGFLDGQPVTVIADLKGKSFEECQERNFGMPLPEGYRKALRLMKQAEKFNRPIVSFVNTSGAFCGIEAEERGQGEAIARNLLEMSGLKVPVLCILIGEGGSGGALATAVGNEVWMLENSTYSILSPEGFASILWKDSSRAQEASEVMNITAQDLKRLGVIEQIIPEFGGAGEDTAAAIAGYMKDHIKEFLTKYDGMSGEDIAKARYQRFRSF